MADNLLKLALFNGMSQNAFKTYSTTLLAIGVIKGGFDEALLADLVISATATDREKILAKQKAAWIYLVLLLQGAPRLILT